jgi:hypothetical protein
MRVVHRIAVRSTDEIRAELAAFGIDVDARGVIGFDVGEDHAAWPAIREWVARRRASDLVSTEFTTSEVDAADWLDVIPEWHHGYPQPDDGGYRSVTYDLRDYCAACGVGARQIAPFRMRGEPRWGRRGILQLNWVFDEYFVRPQVWAEVFEPLGVRCGPVLSARGDRTLETVVQLLVEEEVDLRIEGFDVAACLSCRRPKYLPVVRGLSPGIPADPNGPLVWSAQWFGAGGSGHRLVYASRALHRALRSDPVRGIAFRPVARG